MKPKLADMISLKKTKTGNFAFCQHYFKTSLTQTRISLLLGAVYYSLFIILDKIVLKDFLEILIFIRFGLVVPIILLLFALSFTKKFHNWWQFGISTANIISAYGIIYMTIIASDIVRSSYYPGIILVLIYNYTLVKLRFGWASLSGWIITTGYILSVLLIPGLDKHNVIINIFFMISTNLLGMFAAYILEFYTRETYYAQDELASKKAEIEENNAQLEEIVNNKTESLRKDIAHRIQIEQALHESEEKYRLLVNNSVDCIWQIDSNMELKYISPSIKQLLSYEPEELVGESVIKLLGKESFSLLKKHWQVAQKSDISIVASQLELISKNGDNVSIEVNYKPITKNGEFDGYQGALRDISKLVKTQYGLRKTLKEKEAILDELYHRTKNNLNIITSMLQSRINSTFNLETSSACASLKGKVLSMAMVHESLEENKRLSHINLRKYIDRVSSRIIENNKKPDNHINLSVSGDSVEVLLDTAMPLGLITSEIVSNSVLHAFNSTKHGNILINITHNNSNEICISYKDNGSGLPNNYDYKNPTSLGLRNIFDLVEYQLLGEYTINTDNGFEISITIKEEQYKARI